MAAAGAGGKACTKCGVGYRGFGEVCSKCRGAKGGDAPLKPCVSCKVFFQGFSDCCSDCQATKTRNAAEAQRWSEFKAGAELGVTYCLGCRQPLEDDDGTRKIVTVDDKKFHEGCDVCSKCGGRGKDHAQNFVILPGSGGALVCPECVRKSACAKCGEAVLGAKTVVNGAEYHPSCFRCAACDTTLKGEFCQVEGKPMCKECGTSKQPVGAAVRCVGCRKNILGAYVTAQKGDAFHKECFKCEGCLGPLTSYVVDESLKHKYRQAHYFCAACAKPPPKLASDTVQTSCCICSQDVSEASVDAVLTCLDGCVVHWACFKCCACGAAEQPGGADKRKGVVLMLRAKLDAAKNGGYKCGECGLEP